MKKVIEYRVKLLMTASVSTELQAVEMESCRQDILYWFRNYLFTDKNTNLFTGDEPDVLPFIPYEFQEECIEEVRNSIIDGTRSAKDRTELTNVFIEKSRQMWLSWLLMAILDYWYIFHNHKYHVISQKETDVDKIWDMRSLFEKARFIIRNLPKWMIPAWYSDKAWSTHNKYMTLSKSDWTWSITGESANPNASRSWTYQAVFMDEMAFMQNAATINTAATAATPCRIFTSTPNWEWNEFYRMRKLTGERTDEDTGKKLPPEIKGLRYHWTDHPLYDKAWYDWKIQGMTVEKIAQELEIDYHTALEGRVYPMFKSWDYSLKYSPLKPLYVWIDNSHWWTDPHAIVIAQTDPDNHFIDIIDCIQINCSIPDMANLLSWTPKMKLNNNELNFVNRYNEYNWRQAIFIADPYDTNSTIRNIHNTQGIVIADEYRKVGINLNTPSNIEVKTRIMNTKANIYKLRVNKSCDDFISSVQNARYPKIIDTSNRTTPNEKPIHDRTSHYRTALEYWLSWILENPIIKKKDLLDTRPKRNRLTGKLIYHKE